MNSTRKVGVGLAVAASVLWLMIITAVVVVGFDEGVNIGAALLALLAVPLSIAASVVLLVSRRSAARAGTLERTATGQVAAALAVVSAVLLGAGLVLGPLDHVVGWPVGAVAQLGGIAAFLVATLLFLTPPGRRG